MTKYAHKLIPFPSHFATVDGHSMHYLDEGFDPSKPEKPVVLLLHGNPTWCFYYRNLIARLKKDYRVIAPDYIGCGLSDHPGDRLFRASDRIEQLSEFVTKIGLKRFSLIMHDWGGPIGTGLAVRDPERIEKLVYLNTTLTETEALPTIIKMAASPISGKLLTKYTSRFLKITTGWGVCKKLSREVRKGYYYPYRTAARRTAIWGFVADIPFDSTHPSYAEMLKLAEDIPSLKDVPVQIIWGLKDMCFHREMLNKVAGHFPQAEILEIAEASHLVLEDAPELVGKTIEDFLQGKKSGKTYNGEALEAATPEAVNALCQSFNSHVEKQATIAAVVEPLFLPDSVRYKNTSFAELQRLIFQYQRGLGELGLKGGDRVLMLVPAGLNFLAISYAVMAAGAIPVFIDPGIGRKNLFKCIKDVKPDVLIGAPRAQLLRLKRKQLFPNLKFHITVSDWFFTGGPTLSYLKRFSSKPLPASSVSNTAFIAFTSGATGTPKGVIFTNEMLAAQLKIFREEFKLEAGKRDLPLLPIFSLYNLASGVSSVFPPIDPAKPLSLAPDKVVKVINDLQINYSFGSPTLWNKIAEYCVRGRSDISSIETILMAGAPVSKEVLKRVKAVLPAESEAYTPYGATEALPTTFISASNIEMQEPFYATTGELGTFVGKCVREMVLRVVKRVSGPIASEQELVSCEPGEIGEVIVKGANVSPEYFERPEANKEAKIPSSDRFWHRMGDVGYLDQDGNLYFCGRKAHIVEGSKGIFYSVPIEMVFNKHPKVKRSALIDNDGAGNPAIVIEAFPQDHPQSAEDEKFFAAELLELAHANKITELIEQIYFHPSFPVDGRHNAKIFRDQLGEWARELKQN